MGRFPQSIIKDSYDTTRYTTDIVKRVPNVSSSLIDFAFTNESLLKSGRFDNAVVRPHTVYHERLLNILLNPKDNTLIALENILRKGPYKIAVKHRPRILSAMTDAELLAYSLSTHYVKSIGMHFLKRKINA